MPDGDRGGERCGGVINGLISIFSLARTYKIINMKEKRNRILRTLLVLVIIAAPYILGEYILPLKHSGIIITYAWGFVALLAVIFIPVLVVGGTRFIIDVVISFIKGGL